MGFCCQTVDSGTSQANKHDSITDLPITQMKNRNENNNNVSTSSLSEQQYGVTYDGDSIEIQGQVYQNGTG